MTGSLEGFLDQDRLKDRFRGVLLGLAAGDALGAPLEFEAARDTSHFVTEMVGGGWMNLAPGEWTDDTQMTLCVVASLLAKRVFDPDDIAKRFVAWMHNHPKDIGIHTKKVLQSISDGKPWEQASMEVQAENPEGAANGSLMRCAPLSLFVYRNPDYIAALSPVLSRITHAHPDCEWSCVFINVLLAQLLNGKSKQDAVDAAYDACAEAPEAVKERIGRAMEPLCETSPTGYVLDTLEVAIWSFLHTSDLETALLVSINRGADADTVGAVVGALAGARYGMSSIPERWLSKLYQREHLIDLADSMLELAQSYT